MEKKNKKAEKKETSQEVLSCESRKKSVWELAMDPKREPIITKIVDMRAVLR
ncbi:MAG: hypothetical protein LBG96_00605 [Tannerella sp.]|jgi:hypothetical protein|nr:hypothetical protein [Tannerella sp.]